MKIARIRAGLEQVELARTAGLTEGSYGRYERSDRHIDITTLAAVAGALGVAPHRIVEAAQRNDPEAFHFSATSNTGLDVSPTVQVLGPPVEAHPDMPRSSPAKGARRRG